MLIHTQKLLSRNILTKNPSPWGEIISPNILNMVQVPRDIVPMTGWSYNLSTALTYLRLFIPVFISSFYLIIPEGMIEEEKRLKLVCVVDHIYRQTNSYSSRFLEV